MAPVIYASRAELYVMALPAVALTGMDNATQDSALAAASRVADSYLGSKFQLPLQATINGAAVNGWGEDLKDAVCKIAAYRLLSVRGFNPELGDAEHYRENYKDAIRWLEGVALGKFIPVDIDDAGDADNDTNAAGAAVQADFVSQPTSETITPDDFWGSNPTSVSPARKRGW